MGCPVSGWKEMPASSSVNGGGGAVNWVSLLMRGSLPGRPSEVGRTEQGKGVGLLLMETRVRKTENASNCV